MRGQILMRGQTPMRERIPHAPLGKIPMAFRQPLLSEQGPECSEGVVEPHHCRHARAVLHDRALLDLAGMQTSARRHGPGSAGYRAELLQAGIMRTELGRATGLSGCRTDCRTSGSPGTHHPSASPRPPLTGTRMSRLPLLVMAETMPERSICSSRRAARL